jgi:hypothetical protein
MAGLDPAIHVFDPIKTKTAGESPPFYLKIEDKTNFPRGYSKS